MIGAKVVFELGLNHLGDADRARRMLDTLRAEGATHATIQAAVDFSSTTRDAASIEKVQPNCLTLEEVVDVIKHGCAAGIHMGAVALDPSHVETLVKAGVSFFKVLSSDLSYMPLHIALARTGLPVYLSTGLSSIEHIERALRLIRETVPDADLRLIYTTLQIPTPREHIHLGTIPALTKHFGLPVAYGQHSDVQAALPAALEAGAESVFVYVAEERSSSLPDGPHAILCSDVATLLAELAQPKAMLGETEQVLSTEDQKRWMTLQRSVVAATAIKKGEPITERNITFKRPGTGILAWDAPQVIGQTATKDYEPGEDIQS